MCKSREKRGHTLSIEKGDGQGESALHVNEKFICTIKYHEIYAPGRPAVNVIRLKLSFKLIQMVRERHKTSNSKLANVSGGYVRRLAITL